MVGMLMVAVALTVRVYDTATVPAGELASARTTAAEIFKSAGLNITWTACPCERPLGPTELTVRIIASSSVMPGALGYAYVELSDRQGTLATIFADRVQT